MQSVPIKYAMHSCTT